jgi:hypothetical protein
MKKLINFYTTDSFKWYKKIGKLAVQIGVIVITIIENVAAQGMFIAPNSNFYVHGGSVGIFSNITNAGHLGTKQGTVVKFMGNSWTNDSSATMPDESGFNNALNAQNTGIGGVFSFSNPIANNPQIINGGYHINKQAGANFPNVQIDNANGILLTGNTDIQIRHALDFKNGKLFINGKSLQVGVNDPGIITGYNDKNYIVSGTEMDGGFLYRANVSNANGEVFFPVGADDIYYTPAIIVYKGSAQNFRVRPFNMKYNSDNVIQTTWNIGKSNNEIAEMDVYLDNPASLEANLQSAGNGKMFISHFEKSSATWDTITESEMITANLLNVHNSLHNKVLNGRKFFKSFEQNEYFSKSPNGLLIMPEKIGLAEIAENIELQNDKSSNVILSFIVENKGLVNLNNLSVSNNLNKTFNDVQASFKVLSISATGSLHPNIHFDGKLNGDTSLLQSSSYLEVNKVDTIRLLINVQPVNNAAEIYYNSSYATAQSSLTGNFIKTTSVNGFNTSLAIAATPVFINAVSSVTLLNNPSKLNQFSFISDANFKRLSWQLMDYNGRLVQAGEFRDILKGKVNTSDPMSLNPNGYLIKMNGDGKVLPTLKWIKL